jgi:hypothetical protein
MKSSKFKQKGKKENAEPRKKRKEMSKMSKMSCSRKEIVLMVSAASVRHSPVRWEEASSHSGTQSVRKGIVVTTGWRGSAYFAVVLLVAGSRKRELKSGRTLRNWVAREVRTISPRARLHGFNNLDRNGVPSLLNVVGEHGAGYLLPKLRSREVSSRNVVIRLDFLGFGVDGDSGGGLNLTKTYRAEFNELLEPRKVGVEVGIQQLEPVKLALEVLVVFLESSLKLLVLSFELLVASKKVLVLFNEGLVLRLESLVVRHERIDALFHLGAEPGPAVRNLHTAESLSELLAKILVLCLKSLSRSLELLGLTLLALFRGLLTLDGGLLEAFDEGFRVAKTPNDELPSTHGILKAVVTVPALSLDIMSEDVHAKTLETVLLSLETGDEEARIDNTLMAQAQLLEIVVNSMTHDDRVDIDPVEESRTCILPAVASLTVLDRVTHDLFSDTRPFSAPVPDGNRGFDVGVEENLTREELGDANQDELATVEAGTAHLAIDDNCLELLGPGDGRRSVAEGPVSRKLSLIFKVVLLDQHAPILARFRLREPAAGMEPLVNFKLGVVNLLTPCWMDDA